MENQKLRFAGIKTRRFMIDGYPFEVDEEFSYGEAISAINFSNSINKILLGKEVSITDRYGYNGTFRVIEQSGIIALTYDNREERIKKQMHNKILLADVNALGRQMNFAEQRNMRGFD